MFGKEIEKKMKIFPKFKGIFSIDTLPEYIEGNSGLICNTDASTERGKHWIAIFIDNSDPTIRFGQFFDSFGLPPFKFEFLEFLTRNCDEHISNNIPLQCMDCVTCGQYCCAFLAARFNGFSYADFITRFTPDLRFNDLIVKEFYYKI